MKLLSKIALGLLLVPLVGYAAYNDVSMTSDTVITVSGVNLSVVAPTTVLQSIVVNGSSLDVVMPGNSYLKLTSTDRRLFTATNFSPVVQTSSCTDSASTYTYESPAEASAIAFTITIESSTCTTNVAGGGGSPGSSGGGGGGSSGGSSSASRASKTYSDGTVVYLDQPGAAAKIKELDAKFAAKAAAPKTVAAAAAAVSGGSGLSATQVNSILALLQSFNAEQSVIDNVRISLGASSAGATVAGAAASAATGYTFSKSLKAGSTGAEVRELQKVLNSDSDTQVASSGAGSPGNESALFGPATRAAVKKFQEKYGIAGPGVEGYGNVGPATRAKLNEISGGAAPSTAVPQSQAPAATVSVSGSITKSLAPGVTDSQVKILQQVLNSDSDTQIAASGVGSPGNETSYFGSATLKAVKKFQEKYGISGPGDSGYGLVGPKTRAKLNEVGGGLSPE